MNARPPTPPPAPAPAQESTYGSRDFHPLANVPPARTTYIIENTTSPPPRPPSQGEIIRRTEIIHSDHSPKPPSEKAPSEIPRSVREWDAMSSKRSPSPTPTRRSSRSHHHHHSHSHHASRSRARSLSSASTRRELIIEEDRGESATVHGGVGALIVPHRERRASRNIKQEIRALEAERKALKLERDADRLRGESREEIIITRDRPDTVEIKKDRRGKMSLVR